jgi:tRNA threonylcarbamoyladenosine biosynthesis protein TsaE
VIAASGPSNLQTNKPPAFGLLAASEAVTVQIAMRLAPLLEPGDAVLLDGSLAAGKTYFTRHVVETLKTEDDISSPTYTIANIYQTQKCDVLHVDAYRLANAQEFHNLGLELEIETSICLIEWGTRIAAAFEDYMQISILLVPGQDDVRSFDISAQGPRSTQLLAAFQHGCDASWQ